MTIVDVIRRENAVQTLDFWLDYHNVPRARRRVERREVRATLNDLAAGSGMPAALRQMGPMRDLARAVGEGYADRPRWAVGAYAALPVFAILGYSYLFSAMAYVDGVVASGVTGRYVESRTVAPWFGVRFGAMVRPDHGGFSIGGDFPWVAVVLPLLVFLVVSRPWRLFTRAGGRGDRAGQLVHV